jgi:hypothetical protein
MVPVIGILDGLEEREFSGRLVVMADSGCIDSTSAGSKCYWLIDRLVRIASGEF